MEAFALAAVRNIGWVAVVLGIMILVHEFGHYAAAKLFGEVLDKQLLVLTNQDPKELIASRYEKFRRMGQFFDILR